MLKIEVSRPVSSIDAKQSRCVQVVYTAEIHMWNTQILNLFLLTNRSLRTVKTGGQTILVLDLLTHSNEWGIRSAATKMTPLPPASAPMQPSAEPMLWVQ